MAHGKQTQTTGPDPAITELVEMIERLVPYLRVGTSEEADGEYDDWDAAKELLRRYKPAVTETSSQAS